MTIYVPASEYDIDVSALRFVAFSEFQTRYENTIPAADEERVGALLDDACSLAADITGTIYTVGSVVPGTITATVCTAVRRAYENPLGLGGETIGDYSWRVSAASSGVYFTTEEKRDMRRAAGKSSVGTLELQGLLPDTIDAGIGTPVTVDGITYYIPWIWP